MSVASANLPTIIDTFNKPDTILVLSKYPYRDIDASHHGVATYTQHVLEAVSQQTDQKFVVLVQKEHSRKSELICNNNILILPVFDAGLQMFPQILGAVQHFSQITTLHIHSEFYTSGDVLQMAFSVPFFATIRLFGKHITYFAHNVIDDFGFIADHLGKNAHSWQLQFLAKTVPHYYRALSFSVNRIVVLDESVRQKITRFVADKKLVVTPHWIHPRSYSTRQRTYWRKKFGFTKKDMVIISFGFITHYKGSDWLIDSVTKLRRYSQFKNLQLVLAGGKSPSQNGKKHYEAYYQRIAQRVAQNNHLILTGFIPETELQRYFAIADVIALPYRGILGASGSWAQATAYGKLCLLSQEIASYLDADDAQYICNKLDLHPQQMIFQHSYHHFGQQLLAVQKPKLHQKLAQFSAELAQVRSPKNSLQRELSLLYSPQQPCFSLQSKYVAPLARFLPAFSIE